MAEKVMKIRLQQEMGILQEEFATVRNQKINLFQRTIYMVLSNNGTLYYKG